jgi:hypothetical protein
MSILGIIWSEAVQYPFTAEKALISGIDFKNSELFLIYFNN